VNRSVPSPTNWPEDGRKKKLRAMKSGLRAIDRGTTYDVPGNLQKLVHEINNGKKDRVTDVVLALRSVRNGKPVIRTLYTGKSDMATLHFMAQYLVRDTIAGGEE
jgi:hypothetical protein